MLNQTFDTKSLLQLTRKQEIIKFRLGRNIDEYKESLDNISKKIQHDNFNFESLTLFTKDKRNIFSVDSDCDYYALKKLTYNLKRLYRIKFSNREDISEQVLKILEDGSHLKVIRVDIKNFFESVPFEDLISKIKNDNLLSYKGVELLDKIKECLPKKFTGLPRGLAISSVLSELYMEVIDKRIKELDRIYFYTRYVDDIIIITPDLNLKFKSMVKPIISEHKLQSNNKTSEVVLNNITDSQQTKNIISYLGYEYEMDSLNSRSEDQRRLVAVRLSKNKLNKIKTRIIKAVLKYGKNNLSKEGEIELLKNRIEFLTGNYSLHNDNSKKSQYSEDMGTLKGGIYYNNKLINDLSNLTSLNIFLRNTVFCKRNSNLGKIVKSIPIRDRRYISSLCFKSGFEKRIFFNFTETQFKSICKCW
ncbi:RNA-directed DNA polymerase [Shewanella sp. D64]|uniref:antiviral reverse transcriptase Drt3a n=1 Tax=unclassified Shewanella TaxID=196818 RepID=UPI0022BA35A6|nr:MULTISPECIES: antiviral reverse transcriptase Drt3a [unclassified Shewanella]MEC4726550.1 RNA-directed DNA polymerase [Shewanella sp. D64]MEC4737409.1 RNA-directed DNA polymerase [Shewanella sp. E94]WBJ97228.1 RNA-directed DNA polymerase [Shewanella sp. MTB7]